MPSFRMPSEVAHCAERGKKCSGQHTNVTGIFAVKRRGAPKMWYIVSPKDQAKLDRLAQGMFPQLYKDCHAFMRHKEILLSPALLHSHGIPFMKAGAPHESRRRPTVE